MVEEAVQMSLYFFAIPALESAAAQLHDFYQRKRVLSIERDLVAEDSRSFGAICVTAAPGPP
jgi:hypothetical protein